MLLHGYRTDVKTPERVRQIYVWNQNKSTNTACRQLANQFWDNSTPRRLTGTPEVGLPRSFRCHVFCARKSTTLAFASTFGPPMYMTFRNKTSDGFYFILFYYYYYYYFYYYYLVRNTAADLWLIQFRAIGAYKIFCPLATLSCDCSSANRPRLKSADT